ncbi:carbohydrate ABC transporter permease [Paenibacillus flagellatus]|uniref:ABC transporter permease n=1 Tax=Paenibacillus flagellatus TaxID=2211139 RepID=A0A2V5KII5_9BACL|nr:carbohydrate ABC transporter permease [Paenibacillus flagellatus]PYI54280.1 ABC transporter permease [Paenibacillus flagellatus]
MRVSTGEKWFYAFNYVLLTLAGLSCALPIVHVAALSLSDSQAVLSGLVGLWPVGWTFGAYESLIAGTGIVRAFRNSVTLTVVGVVLSMTFTIMAAYPLSRPYMAGRRFYTAAIVFTMLFGGGLIPTYMVVKALGLINTYAAIWLPGLVSAYNMLVLRSFFQQLPSELDDASRMDGCGELRYLVRIALPLSLPVLAALTLFYAVGYWNAFQNVLIYINSTEKLNMSVMVQQMIRSQSLLQEMSYVQPDSSVGLTPESIKAAGIVASLLPMLIIYPFLQKYFVKGMLLGSVKG